jgi:hypothetical protein
MRRPPLGGVKPSLELANKETIANAKFFILEDMFYNQVFQWIVLWSLAFSCTFLLLPRATFATTIDEKTTSFNYESRIRLVRLKFPMNDHQVMA